MVFDKVAEIVSKNLSINKENVKMETSFDELNADSLDIFQIVIDIEEEFNIKIEETEKMKTVKDIIEYIDQKVKG